MAVKLHPALQRLAELHIISKKKELTDDEVIEFNHCLSVNAKYWWELAEFENLSYVAYTVNDVPWQHEICRQIEMHQDNSH